MFAGQDNLGASLIEICHLNQIHVPQEIAVLGVDDMEFLTENIQVPMSSIDTRLEVLGYEACKRLGELMSGKIKSPAPTIRISPKEVVQRQSTNMLAIDHPAVQAAMTFISTNFMKSITLCQGQNESGLFRPV